MKKLLFSLLFLLSQCGFQPILVNNDQKSFEFKKIVLEGDLRINQKIVNSLSFNESEFNDNLNNLTLNSSFEIQETKKNSKGQVVSYKSRINLTLKITNKNKLISEKNFLREFSYNTKDNKYDLIQYQNEIKKNLINEIMQDVILFMNI